MLTGSVSSPIEAQQAGDLAARLVGGADKVVNSIVVRGRDQVMLKVTVAEVRRDIVKQMGVDLSASMNYGTAVVNFNNTNPFTANNAPLVPGNGLRASALNKAGLPSVTATLRAMESAGVVRTLAEPNLTAISGESATFISGGEFPIPTGVTCQTTTAGAIGQCVQTVSFKKFGISLNFTPVVLTEGRISLRVMTEVSEVSTENALTGGAGGTTIPSIKTRRAETTLEIPSGGSMAMAGLIQEQTKQAVNGLPGLDQLPVLGALFRSQDFVNNQTELMVLVTPYVVRAVAQKELSRPDDGFAPASDSQSTLLGPDQSDLRHSRSRRTRRKLPGQFWLHHRLRARPAGRGQNMTSTTSVDRHRTLRAAGRARRPLSRARCMHLHQRGSRDGERSRRLPPASSDRDPGGQPIDRHFRRSRRAAACLRRNAPTSWDWRGMGPRRDRRHRGRCAGRYPELPSGGEFIPGDTRAPCGRRRPSARHHLAPLPSRRSPNPGRPSG